MVSSSLTFIEELLTSVLDLHKFLEGKVTLARKRCSLLEDVLRPVVTMLSSRSNPGLEISVETDDPLWVEAADPVKLKQLVMNLAKNAVKFAVSGFVRIGAKRLSPERVELWVADSGPGVDPSKAAALFDMYTQCGVEDQGTGIGLALVKQIAEANGGTVELDPEYTSGSSTHGPGARFVAVLSLAEAPAAAVVAATNADEIVAPLRGPYRVLIVDDAPMFRLVVRRYLVQIGIADWRIDEAVNGEACLALLAHDPHKYDLITMDNVSWDAQKRRCRRHFSSVPPH